MMVYNLLKIAFLLALFSFLNACEEASDSNTGQATFTAQSQSNLPQGSGGLKLLQTHCYACHNPTAESHDVILAPPLAGIKWRYQQAYKDRGAFIQHMTEFVAEPKEENALMRGPVRRFGLMPQTAIHRDTIQKIVSYIYDNDLEKPDWFDDHFEEQHGKGSGKHKR